MESPLEPAPKERRMPLIVLAIIAVLVSLGFVFVWPW